MNNKSFENKVLKVYVFYNDSGHGWLAVKRNELVLLGIEKNISHYSYQKGKTVYLEEDRDAGIFITAFKKMFNCDPIFKESYIYGKSPIRNYYNYQTE